VHSPSSRFAAHAQGGDTYGRVRAVVTLDHATELVRHMLVLTLLVAAPVLAAGLIVGLVISLLQAVTQIQEQTISLIPKLIAMAACVALLLPWMGQHVIEYARMVLTDGVMR
jgi:flagellar biosynthetic protein FliQ